MESPPNYKENNNIKTIEKCQNKQKIYEKHFSKKIKFLADHLAW